ncbi:unnamed protein product [Meloidogyne enterolobii]|uniref:Uncharacterized protein n=1 Tax=Meloidogyne enterolobii TaxID=390850 RepID=A0ACB1AZL3_MELEN
MQINILVNMVIIVQILLNYERGEKRGRKEERGKCGDLKLFFSFLSCFNFTNTGFFCFNISILIAKLF